MSIKMECPICNYQMTQKNSRVTRSSLGKQYDWTQFQCRRDDVWIELEIPVTESED